MYYYQLIRATVPFLTGFLQSATALSITPREPYFGLQVVDAEDSNLNGKFLTVTPATDGNGLVFPRQRDVVYIAIDMGDPGSKPPMPSFNDSMFYLNDVPALSYAHSDGSSYSERSLSFDATQTGQDEKYNSSLAMFGRTVPFAYPGGYYLNTKFSKDGYLYLFGKNENKNKIRWRACYQQGMSKWLSSMYRIGPTWTYTQRAQLLGDDFAGNCTAFNVKKVPFKCSTVYGVKSCMYQDKYKPF